MKLPGKYVCSKHCVSLYLMPKQLTKTVLVRVSLMTLPMKKKRRSAQLESEDHACLWPAAKAVPHLPDTECPSEDLAGMVTSAEEGYEEEEEQ